VRAIVEADPRRPRDLPDGTASVRAERRIDRGHVRWRAESTETIGADAEGERQTARRIPLITEIDRVIAPEAAVTLPVSRVTR
jgi:hypothetical protein